MRKVVWPQSRLKRFAFPCLPSAFSTSVTAHE
jgi:hypothetical protein